jgi:hypothetical protein
LDAPGGFVNLVTWRVWVNELVQRINIHQYVYPINLPFLCRRGKKQKIKGGGCFSFYMEGETTAVFIF